MLNERYENKKNMKIKNDFVLLCIAKRANGSNMLMDNAHIK